MRTQNALEVGSHTWSDNWFCTESSRANVEWQWSQTGDIGGDTRCYHVFSAAEPALTWQDIRFCVPTDSPYMLTWQDGGAPPAGQTCAKFLDNNDPFWNTGEQVRFFSFFFFFFISFFSYASLVLYCFIPSFLTLLYHILPLPFLILPYFTFTFPYLTIFYLYLSLPYLTRCFVRPPARLTVNLKC
jgi:hypothetical protein